MPREAAAADDQGCSRPPSRPSIRAPISRSGAVTRSIGRPCDRLVALQDAEERQPGAEPGEQPDPGAGVADVEHARRLVQRRRPRPDAHRAPSRVGATIARRAPRRSPGCARRRAPALRPSTGLVPVGERGEDQRAVRHRLVAGHPQRAAQRAAPLEHDLVAGWHGAILAEPALQTRTGRGDAPRRPARCAAVRWSAGRLVLGEDAVDRLAGLLEQLGGARPLRGAARLVHLGPATPRRRTRSCSSCWSESAMASHGAGPAGRAATCSRPASVSENTRRPDDSSALTSPSSSSWDRVG